MLAREDYFHRFEAQCHGGAFTHTSISPKQQPVAGLDVARRQMELDGFKSAMSAIELARDIRSEFATHPIISKYFDFAGPDGTVPQKYCSRGFVDFLAPDTHRDDQLYTVPKDEFCLAPTRMRPFRGTACFDSTYLSCVLASERNILFTRLRAIRFC